MTLKYQYTFILVVFITIVGCKKESFLSGKDHISYTEFNPAPELTSVDSLVYNFSSVAIAYPQDSSVSYLLDINNDSKADFQLTVNHWYDFVSASGPEANYNNEMSIKGINEHSEIATIEDENRIGSFVRFYAEIESIDPKAKWENSTKLWHSGGNADTHYTAFTGTQYIGLRIQENARRNYCWLKINRDASTHKLTILSCGYNKSHGNNILAGQK